ncbi:MAG TPA: type III-B CRISPR module RAMP protein Cmr1 [Hydrogenobaculum sp.]|nr:type III-B CRISPR module RAMP protein Cmr1 [Hydrogenobaculum sp.]
MLGVKKLVLYCKIISPMFMGVDGRSAELRPSGFKGMMRFWWRAMKSDKDVERLRNEENKIFGGVNKDEGKSKINIRIYPIGRLDIENSLKKIYSLDFYYDKISDSIKGKDVGSGYLLYSVMNRQFIKDGCKFKIEVSSFYEEAFKNAVASLWASIYLGGFGSRSRRGAGNISVEGVDGDTYGIDFKLSIGKQDNIVSWLKENLEKCLNILNGAVSKDPNIAYSNISNLILRISKSSFRDWKEALNDIGNRYFNFRLKNKHKILEVGVFGLPVLHRNKDKVIAVKEFASGRKVKINRRSSPIIFKLIYTQNMYFWLLIRLNGKFLEDGFLITLDKQQENKPSSKIEPNYKIIDAFWESLKAYSEEYVLKG